MYFTISVKNYFTSKYINTLLSFINVLETRELNAREYIVNVGIITVFVEIRVSEFRNICIYGEEC